MLSKVSVVFFNQSSGEAIGSIELLLSEIGELAQVLKQASLVRGGDLYCYFENYEVDVNDDGLTVYMNLYEKW